MLDDAKLAAGRHLTLVDGPNDDGTGDERTGDDTTGHGTSGGAAGDTSRPSTRLRRLRAAVLQEYLDKLPDFLPVADILQMCGMRYPELADAADRGRVILEKRADGAGIVVADNLTFLREQRLLQLPVPLRVRVGVEPTGELVGVSWEAYAELARRADESGTDIATVIDALLSP